MSTANRRVAPGFSHHIVLEGHNHRAIFNHQADYQEYLAEAGRVAECCRVDLQGWCLLPWRLHLLAACPEDDGEALAQVMKKLGAFFTRYHHTHYGGDGTIWNGRYHCSVVQPGQWRLALLRYLETLPLYYDMAKSPRGYSASSYRARMGSLGDEPLRLDPDFRALAITPMARREAYREFLALGCDTSERALIEKAVARNCVTGDDRFVEEMAERFGIHKKNRGPGRPPKTMAARRRSDR